MVQTIHVVPDVTLRYSNIYFPTEDPAPPFPSSLVGADPWDLDPISYSHTVSTFQSGNHWGRAVGTIPPEVLAVLAAAPEFLGLTVTLTAKYADDAATGVYGQPLIIGMVSDTSEAFLVRGPDYADAFRLDARDAVETHASSTWTANAALTTLANVRQLLLDTGEISVFSPSNAAGGDPFSTHAWVYALAFDITIEGGAAPALRMYPRDGDGHGWTSARRIYPPPRSRRVIGRQP